MIRVDKINIEEFRGIRDLTLDLSNTNFAVCGPNGTGKSGIVDAIEFALTGSISRLAGRGTGGVSVKDHGPHVDSRNRPDKAKVTLTAFIPSLNKTVTIHRSVKQPSVLNVTPNDPDVLTVLKQLELHPEFVLSRRELIRYILSAPGERAKEVQALLRLDSIEGLRTTLQKIANASSREARPLEAEKKQAGDNLLRALELSSLSRDKVLVAVNARRAILSLPPLIELEATTSLKDGVTVVAADKSIQIPKAQALSDLDALQKALVAIESAESTQNAGLVSKELEELNADPVASNGLLHQSLLNSAVRLFDERHCPVCETEWNPEEFRSTVNAKLAHLDDVARKRSGTEKLLAPIISTLGQIESGLATGGMHAKALKLPLIVDEVEKLLAQVQECRRALTQILPLESSLSALARLPVLPNKIRPVATKLEAALKALPEPTQQDAARDYLTIGQERLEHYRGVSLRLKQAEERAALSKRIYDCYLEVSTEILDSIYKDVEKDFSDLYRAINREDEGAFSAQLTPSMGKLGFDVDFYGRGFFPPGAYHSEGHQDSMGLCLYLALMKHLLGVGFTFAVLDDVLMSVDSGHRRAVCEVLKAKFSDTQFIFTTHDEIWLRHMKTAGLITPGASAQFRQWTVEHGPSEWDQFDVWQEIDNHLARNDVRAAAALLRHYLEHAAAEICHQLRANVEFRGDAQYELGNLMPGAIGGMRRALKSSKKAAQSWEQKELFELNSRREEEFSAVATASNVEQWQINAAVHYNEWANLAANDFRPVVDSFRTLLAQFSCPKCLNLYHVSPERGAKTALRCACGQTNINLVAR